MHLGEVIFRRLVLQFSPARLLCQGGRVGIVDEVFGACTAARVIVVVGEVVVFVVEGHSNGRLLQLALKLRLISQFYRLVSFLVHFEVVFFLLVRVIGGVLWVFHID